MRYAYVAFIPHNNTTIAITANDGHISNAESAAVTILNNSARLSETRAEAGC